MVQGIGLVLKTLLHFSKEIVLLLYAPFLEMLQPTLPLYNCDDSIVYWQPLQARASQSPNTLVVSCNQKVERSVLTSVFILWCVGYCATKSELLAYHERLLFHEGKGILQNIIIVPSFFILELYFAHLIQQPSQNLTIFILRPIRTSFTSLVCLFVIGFFEKINQSYCIKKNQENSGFVVSELVVGTCEQDIKC